MSHQSIRAFIVEDHLIVRSGLIELFAHTSEGGKKITCVGEAISEVEALAKIPDVHPDVIVVDLNLEESNGLSLIEKLIKKNPKERIVVFSMRDAIQTVASAFRMGVLGYVTKSDSPMMLIDAIRAADEGKFFFVPGLGDKLAAYQMRADREDPRTVLTEKELELFVMLAEGVRLEGARERLGVTTKSISNRVASIRKALNCVDADFTRIAIKYGLISSI